MFTVKLLWVQGCQLPFSKILYKLFMEKDVNVFFPFQRKSFNWIPKCSTAIRKTYFPLPVWRSGGHLVSILPFFLHDLLPSPRPHCYNVRRISSLNVNDHSPLILLCVFCSKSSNFTRLIELLPNFVLISHLSIRWRAVLHMNFVPGTCITSIRTANLFFNSYVIWGVTINRLNSGVSSTFYPAQLILFYCY